MCGIAGVVSAVPLRLSAGHLRAASAALSHRGPDDEGFATIRRGQSGTNVLVAGGNATDSRLRHEPLSEAQLQGAFAAFVHRRLSIIDLSPDGHQPYVLPRARGILAFNGEIYNYRELRQELARAGIQCTTESDTEVLAEALAAWGLDAVPRLIGMFAFAFFDLRREALLLCRDTFGIKPLYYTTDAQSLYFASEVRALRALGVSLRDVDRGVALEFLLAGKVDHKAETMLHDLCQLLPGECLEVSANGDALKKIPSLPVRDESSSVHAFANDAQRADHLHALVRESVALHLRADVPVGVLLSGGLDSTILTAMMRRELGESAELQAFSYIAEDSSFSEEPFVDQVAARFRVDVRKRRLDFAHLFESGRLRAVMEEQEFPFATPSIVAQNAVYEDVRAAGFKVVLDGQGADELFLGYSRYYSRALESALRKAQFLKVLSGVRSRSDAGDLSLALLRIVPPAVSRLLLQDDAASIAASWLSESWVDSVASVDLQRSTMHRHPPADEVQRACLTFPLPSLLRYADRNAMNVSVENRVPFCIRSLFDFARAQPIESHLGIPRRHKQLLRYAFALDVPPEIMHRRKVGFEVPPHAWHGEVCRDFPRILRRLQDAGASPFAEDVLADGNQLRTAAAKEPALLWRAYNLACWTLQTVIA
jgi:asparagine synthase (glutamine-hydrolysing)